MDIKQFFWPAILVLFSTNLAHAAENDSIKIQQENGALIILHEVESEETLFSLSQRYRTSIESIVTLNQITNNTLSVGTILKIPWPHGITHRVEPGQTLYSLSKMYQVSVNAIKDLNGISGNDLDAGSVLLIARAAPGKPKVTQHITAPGYHIVTADETLYSLSKKYNLEVEKLKDWNQLADNNVRIGDTLRLKEPEPTSKQSVVEPAAKPQQSARRGEAKPVQQHGIAAVIDGTTDSKKYLALHPSAPYGTIMKVRNELTNLSVFVRVVGPLPATGANNNILIRLSPAAQEALGALDNKFRVELSYVSQ